TTVSAPLISLSHERSLLMRIAIVPSILLVSAILLGGCHGSSTTAANFFPSATPSMPGLVKLVGNGSSGSRVVVDVLIYGPEPDADLSGFAFGVRVGDANVARLVSEQSYPQSALVADAGQTVAIDVDGATDPSVVRIGVAKQGGGAGNGIPGASAVV